MRQGTLYVDGGARPTNPGPSACAYVLVEDDQIVRVYEDSIFLGEGTNNTAEYRGLIAGLEAAIENGFDRILVKSDSQMLVNQMNGYWAVHNEMLRTLRLEARRLARNLEYIVYQWIPRRENRRADELVGEAFESVEARR